MSLWNFNRKLCTYFVVDVDPLLYASIVSSALSSSVLFTAKAPIADHIYLTF